MPDFSVIARIFKDYLLPTSCPVCQRNTEKSGICKACCGILELSQLGGGIHSLDVGGYTVRCRAVFSYEYEQAANLVLFIKENPDSTVFKYLSVFLAREVRAFNLTGKTVITYVPRSSEGLRENGFDQSEYLAKAVAKLLPDTVCMKLLARTGRSRAQKRLSGKDRKENVKGKFRAVKTAASPKNIVITDDMFTTGSSVTECASVLRKAYPGAEIFCVTVAKNPNTRSLNGTERI